MMWLDEVSEICDYLAMENIVLLPTDTVWGLSCDAHNLVAIHRILKLKQQPEDAGMICLVSSLEMLRAFVPVIHPRLETLLSLHRRPLTVLYGRVDGLSDLLRGPSGKWAIRVTTDPYMQAIIEKLGRPIIATIPARWGEEAPSHFGAIGSDFLEAVDFIARWRRHEKQQQIPSPIVELDKHKELVFLRQ